mgnify:CR=1 FL=1
MSHNPHSDGEFVLINLSKPSLVIRIPAGIIGREGEGEGGASRSEGGEETKLPKVFPPDSPHGVKDERLMRMRGRFVTWDRCIDGVGEKTGLSCRDSGGKEKRMVP